jgi:hypothetical protein
MTKVKVKIIIILLQVVEKDAHVAGVVNRRTSARFSAPPVFLEAIDLFLGKHKSPPEVVALV